MFGVRLASKRPVARLWLGMAVAGVVGLSGSAGAQGVAAAATDLVAPLAASSAQIRFHEGLIANNQPLIDPVLPAVPGPVSSWVLTQWNHAVYLRPADLKPRGFGAQGRNYGAVAWDLETQLLIRHKAGETGFVFTLQNSNGTLSAGGGRALYLTAGALPGVNSGFDHEIDLAMDARVASAAAIYDTPAAKATGAVMAMAYTGIGLLFTDPTTGAQQYVFMQVGLTLSKAPQVGSGYICSGNTVILWAPPVAAAEQLPFTSDAGPLHHLSYNLTAAVQDMVSNATPCGGTTPVWTPAKLNLANWRLTGTYFGSETENTDLRPGAATNDAQGMALLTLDLADFSIRRK